MTARALRLLLDLIPTSKHRHRRPVLTRFSWQPSKAGISPSWQLRSRMGSRELQEMPEALTHRAELTWGQGKVVVSPHFVCPEAKPLLTLASGPRGHSSASQHPGQVFHEIIQYNRCSGADQLSPRLPPWLWKSAVL